MIKFKDLKIGDVFSFLGIHFVKIADNPNCMDRLCYQYPNSINLDNAHYSVISYNSSCELIKSRTDERYRP